MNELITTSPSEINNKLAKFSGTNHYHRHRLLNGMELLLTDGCEFLRDGCMASWLFDLILSWQMKLRKHRFQVWKLEKQVDGTWYIECTDGNNLFIVGQEIGYCDFPLDRITIWVVDGIALLPTEY